MIFREGVVRDNRGLSTTPAFAWQILKNETHVCVFLVYAYMGLFYLLIVILRNKKGGNDG